MEAMLLNFSDFQKVYYRYWCPYAFLLSRHLLFFSAHLLPFFCPSLLISIFNFMSLLFFSLMERPVPARLIWILVICFYHTVMRAMLNFYQFLISHYVLKSLFAVYKCPCPLQVLLLLILSYFSTTVKLDLYIYWIK